MNDLSVKDQRIDELAISEFERAQKIIAESMTDCHKNFENSNQQAGLRLRKSIKKAINLLIQVKHKSLEVKNVKARLEKKV